MLNGKKNHGHNHPLGEYLNATSLKSLLGIESSNKYYINCAFVGPSVPGTIEIRPYFNNKNGTDTDMIFELLLPYVLGNYELYLENLLIGIKDGDGNDFIDRIRITGFTNHTSSSTIFDDNNGGSGWSSIQEHDVSIGLNLSGYKRVIIRLECTFTNARDYDMSYCLGGVYYV